MQLIVCHCIGTKQLAYYEKEQATIRCDGCQVLVLQQSSGSTAFKLITRCDRCQEYRLTLNRMLNRSEHKRSNDDKTSIHSHTNYRYLRL